VNKKERITMILILLSISLITVMDLITDSKEGVAWWHVFLEGSVGIVAVIGVFFLLKGTLKLKYNLAKERKISESLEQDNQLWKERSKKFIEGLSESIDHQLVQWKLTRSEKEVAFMLLKGYSLKEVARLRNTTEKTARAQSAAIYAKAGVSGRSQLSAFFLEDLLVPQ